MRPWAVLVLVRSRSFAKWMSCTAFLRTGGLAHFEEDDLCPCGGSQEVAVLVSLYSSAPNQKQWVKA